ncbi:MAG TPA: hypothetical protein VJN63_09360 [Thermoplasmata archaeon]|nr:hypothetical protein [Thermoplasmata archaeon]
MTEPDRCPMCGQELEWRAIEMVCGTCRMGISADRTYYIVHGHGRHNTFCSAGCVRTHILMVESA